MQIYHNNRNKPLETVYKFFLEENYSVVGYEAVINGKSVIGEVKSKEQVLYIK